MGVSGPVAFAVLLIASLVSFGMLYASGETLYSMMHRAETDHTAIALKMKTSELVLQNYTYDTNTNVTVYDITFTVLNAGNTLSPEKWTYIFDGFLDNTSVVGSTEKYLLPGEAINVTVQNMQKENGVVHSLVISTEVGCGLKIKWEWSGNVTDGSPQVIGSAWYCPVEG